MVFYLLILFLSLLFATVGLMVRFLVAPLRTLAAIVQKIVGFVALFVLILACSMWLGDGGKNRGEVWIPVAVFLACGVVAWCMQWVIDRPTRIERRQMKQIKESLESVSQPVVNHYYLFAQDNASTQVPAEIAGERPREIQDGQQP